MAATRTLTDRDEIRDWAAARMGSPAISEASPSVGGDDPILSIVFDQASYQDQDRGADASIALGGREIVEWDDWFKIFEEKQLALVVSEEVPGRKDSFHEIVAR
ncbi:hypothetical protein PZ895_17885 [Mesorhizobium sp. YIM 152430]|jgi:hypothetical protein|uniref:hypothetical protein n=1 Tax=Mesorhizobium sp. YIM 152430 TaxID=3031761 RepID=UPI0023DB7904|nr:hypothetical protein [Mesorhizobium sp. YIM 152430]MDF1601630.1 hypothetical protein [Mesorhizobium sp. YIM 152430]